MARRILVGAIAVLVVASAFTVVALRGAFGRTNAVLVMDVAGTVADVIAYIPGRVRPRHPKMAEYEVGVFYRFSLHTHCGVEYTPLDGRYWRASPPLFDGPGDDGNPPAGWGNPITPGKMKLLTRDRAVFVADSGPVAEFEVLGDEEPADAGCM